LANGDPAYNVETIEQLKRAINSPDDQVKPIFGICLSNQLLGLATGRRAKEHLFSDRGQNQPVINHAICECYVTSQSHGYHRYSSDLMLTAIIATKHFTTIQKQDVVLVVLLLRQ
jgi:carbamoylphosphate synthase small subunit